MRALHSEPTQETRNRWIDDRIQRVDAMLNSALRVRAIALKSDPQAEDEQEQIAAQEWIAFGNQWEERIHRLSNLKKYLEFKRGGLLAEDASVTLPHGAKLQMTAEIIRYFSQKNRTAVGSIFFSVPAPLGEDCKHVSNTSCPIRPASEFVEGEGLKLTIGEATPILRGRVLFHASTYTGPSTGSGYVFIFNNEDNTWTVEVNARDVGPVR